MKLLDVLTSPWAILPDKLLEIQAISTPRTCAARRSTLRRSRRGSASRSPTSLRATRCTAALRSWRSTASVRQEGQPVLAGVRRCIDRDRGARLSPGARRSCRALDHPGHRFARRLRRRHAAARVCGSRCSRPEGGGRLRRRTMASAAYWVGSAADQVLIGSDTVQVGRSASWRPMST